MSPSFKEIAYWAQNDPERYRQFLHSDANAGIISVAIQVSVRNPGDVMEMYREDIIKLVDHPHPHVQEAALFWLEDSMEVDIDRLRKVAEDMTRHESIREHARLIVKESTEITSSINLDD